MTRMQGVTLEDWMESDDRFKMLGIYTPGEPGQPWTSELWAQRVLKPQLGEAVPDEVYNLFEMARGAMVYSWFFYPLHTLALEQLARVGEAAVWHKSSLLGCPKGKSFAKRIDWLVERNIITAEQKEWWHIVRKIRNARSHLEEHMIVMPDTALGWLRNLVNYTNALFAA